MAYYNIEKRLKSDGTPRYRCNVIIKEKGVITYRESKTFPKHAHAKTWGTQKVMDLDLYGISSSNAVDGLTVRDLLHKYLNDQMPEVKQAVLKDMCWNCLWIVTSPRSNYLN